MADFTWPYLQRTTMDPRSRTCRPPHWTVAAQDDKPLRCQGQIDMQTNVAAHVHAETIPEAISPGFTLRDALVNSSEFEGEKGV